MPLPTTLCYSPLVLLLFCCCEMNVSVGLEVLVTRPPAVPSSEDGVTGLSCSLSFPVVEPLLSVVEKQTFFWVRSGCSLFPWSSPPLFACGLG